MIAPRPGVIFAAALLCAACPPAWGQGVTARTVALGQSAPLSGPSRAHGEDIRNGALAYLRALNDAGGVHGRRIELATLDDGGEPERALANSQRLVEELRVFALFGYPAANVSRELLAQVQKGRVPFFAPVTGAQLARQPARYVFTVRAGHADEVERVVAHYTQLGLKRFALVRRDDAEGTEIADALRAALRRRGLAEGAAALLKPGRAAEAAHEALVADAEVILVAAPAASAADLLRSLKRAGSPAQPLVLSLADPAVLARALGAQGAGVALSQVVPPLERTSLPVVADYRAAMEAETGRKDYSPASLEAYIAAKVFAEAVRRAGPALTRDALLLALEAMSAFDTGGYVVGFSRSNHQGSARIELLAIGRDGGLLH
jgi:ABC-type branched-subunit amino acid transport system substrate-binding protein